MNEEIDIIVFEDEQGQEIEFELQFSFDHEGKEYAVLTELDADVDGNEMPDLYLFEIVGEGDDEIFVPIEEDVLESLADVVEAIFDQVVATDDEQGE